MLERELLAFLACLQLKCGKDHHRSDLVLHTLQRFRRGEITREHCVSVIFTLLRPFKELKEKFAMIIEETPPPQTLHGCVAQDPYVNTAIEFGIWPGALGHFLWKCRRAIFRQCTMEDAFVDLECIKNTSGPFWLLWELYEPVLGNGLFMQMIFDGCIGLEMMPLHLKMPAVPSESDADLARVCATSMVDSDLVCCYQTDCRQDNRPLGLLKHGSYGLLDRRIVDVACSGRTVRDWAVLNDRWATNATGSEAQFHASEKNQYEEKLFMMEDERVQLDVKICRMKTLMAKLDRGRKRLAKGKLPKGFDVATFPRGFLSQVDMLTLKELYDNSVRELLDRMAEDPRAMFEIVQKRIADKLEVINEVRRNKEKDYHDLNKRNYPRSLEVVKVDQQSVPPSQYMWTVPETPEVTLEFTEKGVQDTLEVFSRAVKDVQVFGTVVEFINVILGMKEPEPLQKVIAFTAYPSLKSKSEGRRKWLLSQKQVQVMQLIQNISQTITILMNSQSSTEEVSASVEDARGLRYAVALGHVPEAVLRPNFAQEAVMEALPQFVATGRHNPGLESLFEGPEDLPLPNSEALKRAINHLIRLCEKLALDESSQLLLEAVKCPEDEDYYAITLEKLSGKIYYTATSENVDGTIRLTLNIQLPRQLKTRRSAQIINHMGTNAVLVWDSYYADHQTRMLTAKNTSLYKASKQTMGPRTGQRNLEFRFGPHGVEFRGPGVNITGHITE